MFKKQFKDNLGTLIIFCIALTILYCGVFLIYPILAKDLKELIERLVELVPKDSLNFLSTTELATPAGWITSKGIGFFLICGSVYSSILGSSCLFVEKKDKTIEFLAVKPVTRTEILIKKGLADVLCIALFTVVNCAVIIAGLSSNPVFKISSLLLATLTPAICFLVFWVIFLFISIVYKGSFGVAFGVSIVFYIFIFLSKFGEKIEFLKFLSPFALSDTIKILHNGTSPVWSFFAGFGFFLVLGYICIYLYNKKELL